MVHMAEVVTGTSFFVVEKKKALSDLGQYLMWENAIPVGWEGAKGKCIMGS